MPRGRGGVIMPCSIVRSDKERIMDQKFERERVVPGELVVEVGKTRSEKARQFAIKTIKRLDRNHHWNQEPAHVFQAESWRSNK